MNFARPSPTLENYSPLAPETIVLARLAGARNYAMTPIDMAADLAGLLTPQDTQECLDALVAKGDVERGAEVQLSRQGVYAAKLILGAEGAEHWSQTRARRLPLLTLGLKPSDRRTRIKYGRPELLKSAIIAVAYGLPQSAMESAKDVCSALVWRLLQSGLPDIIGGEPFPRLNAFGPVERALLAGLAHARFDTIFETVSVLAARALEMQSASVPELRDRLICVGVRRALLERALADRHA